MRTVEVEKSMNRRQFLAVLALLLVLLGIWGGLRLSGGTGNTHRIILRSGRFLWGKRTH